MPDLGTLAAGSILSALILYVLLGGADFGVGVWDLFSRGPRTASRRLLIAHAIGPVWETNHIWIIVAVVVLFNAFPRAFAVVSTALFVPLTLMLAGIVVRGAAFAFHHYHQDEEGDRRWGRLFAAASLLTPLLLGVIIGAVSTGKIPAQAATAVGTSRAWIEPFPLAVGVLTLAVFSYLAAIYLILETGDRDLREDFRTRALWSSAAVAGLLIAAPLVARHGAPDFFRALAGSAWSLWLVGLVAAAALGAHAALLARRYVMARACAAAEAALILIGWGAAQYPFLVRPDLSISSAVSPPATVRLMLIALATGVLFLFPSIFVLFRTFKGEAVFGRPRAPSSRV